MSINFFNLQPVSILADRSKDRCSGRALDNLIPSTIFSVTQNDGGSIFDLLDLKPICLVSWLASAFAALLGVIQNISWLFIRGPHRWVIVCLFIILVLLKAGKCQLDRGTFGSDRQRPLWLKWG